MECLAHLVISRVVNLYIRLYNGAKADDSSSLSSCMVFSPSGIFT